MRSPSACSAPVFGRNGGQTKATLDCGAGRGYRGHHPRGGACGRARRPGGRTAAGGAGRAASRHLADGPPSGSAIGPGPINGRTPPFPSQPVQGFSALIGSGRAGVYLALADNGYGARPTRPTSCCGPAGSGRAGSEQAAGQAPSRCSALSSSAIRTTGSPGRSSTRKPTSDCSPGPTSTPSRSGRHPTAPTGSVTSSGRSCCTSRPAGCCWRHQSRSRCPGG